jgi:hypothetical protein
MLPPKKTDPKKLQKLFDPTQEDFLPVRKVVAVTNPDGSKSYQYFYDKLPTEEGYDESLHSSIFTAQEHQAKQTKNSPEFSKRAVGYLDKTKGKLNRDVEKMVTTVPTTPTTLTQSTEEIIPQLAYGTSNKGITRKKYAMGTSGVHVKSYMQTPQEAMVNNDILMTKAELEAQNNPYARGVEIGTQILSQFASSGAMSGGSGGKDIAGGTGSSGTQFSGGNFMSPEEQFRFEQSHKPLAAMGHSGIPAGEVELEGDEVVQTPNGEVAELQGPSHEQGGIPMQVGDPNSQLEPGSIPEDSEAFSKRVFKDGKNMADRKLKRERTKQNLLDLLDKGKADIAIKNTVERKISHLEKEEQEDLAFQEMASLFSQVQEFAYGSGAKGIKKYANGTGPGGVNFSTGLPMNANIQEALAWAASQKMDNALADTDKAIADNVLQSIQVDNTINTAETNNQKMLETLPKSNSNPIINPSTNIPYSFDITEALKSLPKSTEAPLTPTVENTESTENVEGIARQFGNFEGQTPTHSNVEEPGAVSKLFKKIGQKLQTPSEGNGGYVPTSGDLLTLAGTAYSAFAPMSNTLENRAGDTANINAYKDFGKDSLETLARAAGFLSQEKDNSNRKLTSRARASKNAGRAGARGINQVRAMDLATDMGVNEEQGNIDTAFANKTLGLLGQEASLKTNIDQMVMKGAQDADLANRQDRDNFYTQLGKDKATKGQGIQQLGKNVNSMLQNPLLMNLLDGMGDYVTMDAKGNIKAKNRAKTTKKSEEEKFEKDMISKGYKKDEKGNWIKN